MTDPPARQAGSAPKSVGYAKVLLYLQASIWGLVCIGAMLLALNAKSAAPGGIALDHNPALACGAAGLALALAVAKAWLGRRISRRSRWTRQAVVTVEFLMAGFGAVLCLLTVNLDGGVILFFAGLVGGIWSLIVAIRLTRPPARQYFAGPGRDSTSTNPTPQPGDGGQGQLFTGSAHTPRNIIAPLPCQ